MSDYGWVRPVRARNMTPILPDRSGPRRVTRGAATQPAAAPAILPIARRGREAAARNGGSLVRGAVAPVDEGAPGGKADRMGLLKVVVVLAVVAGLSVNVWARRGRRGRSGGAIPASIRARSSAFGDAVLVQAVVLMVALLAGANEVTLWIMLAGMIVSVASFWFRLKVERTSIDA